MPRLGGVGKNASTRAEPFAVECKEFVRSQLIGQQVRVFVSECASIHEIYTQHIYREKVITLFVYRSKCQWNIPANPTQAADCMPLCTSGRSLAEMIAPPALARTSPSF